MSAVADDRRTGYGGKHDGGGDGSDGGNHEDGDRVGSRDVCHAWALPRHCRSHYTDSAQSAAVDDRDYTVVNSPQSSPKQTAVEDPRLNGETVTGHPYTGRPTAPSICVRLYTISEVWGLKEVY
ncbi:Hypothetical protein CINCED_3A015468 [Cinara cedri]|nr:Hypothetical protein CINCED_3A015468 [Cinara cedri]